MLLSPEELLDDNPHCLKELKNEFINISDVKMKIYRRKVDFMYLIKFDEEGKKYLLFL